MYIHPKFAIGEGEALDLAGRVGFGLLTAHDDGGLPMAVHVPFVFTARQPGEVRLACHVARNNAIATLADGQRPFLFGVTGPDTYISPDWYHSRDQVPTWLYEAVHFTGTLRQLPTEGYLAHVDALSAEFEQRLLPKKPWLSAKMPPERLAMMLRGIVALEMTVTRIEGQRKLNQHKSDADYLAIATALAGSPDAKAQTIARMMHELRPDLAANGDKA